MNITNVGSRWNRRLGPPQRETIQLGVWKDKTRQIGEDRIKLDWNRQGTTVKQLTYLWMMHLYIFFRAIATKYELQENSTFWRYFQTKNCISKGQWTNPVRSFLELPDSTQQQRFIEILILNQDIYRSWRTEASWMWTKWGMWMKVNTYSRFYFNPSRLTRMRFWPDNLGWKCKMAMDICVCAMGMNRVCPFWVKVETWERLWISR